MITSVPSSATAVCRASGPPAPSYPGPGLRPRWKGVRQRIVRPAGTGFASQLVGSPASPLETVHRGPVHPSAHRPEWVSSPTRTASGIPSLAGMDTQHIDTLIVGAGQAGLATGYHLTRLGRESLIVDGNGRIGDNWRCHYDSLTLYSPAKFDGLPGMDFPGDPWHFPGKDEVAAFLEQYAVEMELPVRMHTRVDRLVPRDGGGFTAHLASETIECDNVVVATGTFGRAPRVPDVAASLAPHIRQLHSTEYRNPTQLRPGTTAVVGASHSGYGIAYEVAADRPTILVGPDRGNIPLDWRSARVKVELPLIVFLWKHVLTRRTPVGRKMMDKVRHHGAPTARVRPHHLRRACRGTDRAEGHRRLRRRQAGTRRRAGPRRRQRHLGDRLPAGLRLDRGADHRRRRMAARVPRRGRRGARVVLLRALVPVRVQLDGATRCRPGRGVRRSPDPPASYHQDGSPAEAAVR